MKENYSTEQQAKLEYSSKFLEENKDSEEDV